MPNNKDVDIVDFFEKADVDMADIDDTVDSLKNKPESKFKDIQTLYLFYHKLTEQQKQSLENAQMTFRDSKKLQESTLKEISKPTKAIEDLSNFVNRSPQHANLVKTLASSKLPSDEDMEKILFKDAGVARKILSSLSDDEFNFLKENQKPGNQLNITTTISN